MSNDNLIRQAADALLPNDTSVVGHLVFMGQNYEIETFETEFQQPVDFKEQPQHEVKGGLLSITMKQTGNEDFNRWMFQRDIFHDGAILFVPESRISNVAIDVQFKEARCIYYEKIIGNSLGIRFKLIISAKIVTINGIEHHNCSVDYLSV